MASFLAFLAWMNCRRWLFYVSAPCSSAFRLNACLPSFRCMRSMRSKGSSRKCLSAECGFTMALPSAHNRTERYHVANAFRLNAVSRFRRMGACGGSPLHVANAFRLNAVSRFRRMGACGGSPLHVANAFRLNAVSRSWLDRDHRTWDRYLVANAFRLNACLRYRNSRIRQGS